MERGQEETVASGQWSVAEDENGKTRRREDVKKARERGVHGGETASAGGLGFAMYTGVGVCV